jgi:hypothetical protein
MRMDGNTSKAAQNPEIASTIDIQFILALQNIKKSSVKHRFYGGGVSHERTTLPPRTGKNTGKSAHRALSVRQEWPDAIVKPPVISTMVNLPDYSNRELQGIDQGYKRAQRGVTRRFID